MKVHFISASNFLSKNYSYFSIMEKMNLHDIFVEELYKREPKKVDLINQISDILMLEKESVYRRMAGKVNFSVREMGVLAKTMNISLDSLLYDEVNLQWLPFVLESPCKFHSMDSLYNMIEFNLKQIGNVNRDEPGETGSVHNSLPLEFCIVSPLMMKFLFFKWGNYFVQSEEFNNFSQWNAPYKLTQITEKYNEVYHFEKAFYIWDNSLIWTMAKEIDNFYRMHIITPQEKEDIKDELKDILSKIEMALNGTYTPNIPFLSEIDFLVSSTDIGFTSGYYVSGNKHLALFQTNFSFSIIENSEESFKKIKEWIKSFCKISTLLSRSGRIERRLFFNQQYNIIDDLLK